MMKILKRVGMAVGGLFAVLILVGTGLNVRGRSMASSAPPLTVKPVAEIFDSTAIARGRHLAEAVVGCEHCHGAGLSGQPFGTPAVLISMAAPNLTRGEGGVGASYNMVDWDRAIRHGVGKDGRRLAIMPAEAYTHLSDADFAALISYLRTVPSADRSFPARRIGVLGGTLIGAGKFPLAPELIDHNSVGKRSVTPAVSAEYGHYLADIAGCTTCHGPDLKGRESPGGDGPAPPSLIAFAEGRTVDDFRQTIRTGRSPTGGGRNLNPDYMPWGNYARMTDDELQAIFLYIQSSPPNPKPR